MKEKYVDFEQKISIKPLANQEFKNTLPISCYYENGEIVSGLIVYLPDHLPTGIYAKNIFCVDKKVFVYCTDNCLYYLNDGGYGKVIDTAISTPSIFSIYANGEKKIMVQYDNKTVFIGQTIENVDLKKYDGYVDFYGRLLAYSGNKIYYDLTFDALNIGKIGKFNGEINLDQEFGDILYMVKTDDGLIVVCRYKIIKLLIKSVEKDFCLIVVDYEGLNIMENTIKKVGNNIYFISDNNLMSYDGKINKVKSLLDDKTYEIGGQAVSRGDSYILPVIIDNVEYFYIYGEHEYFIVASGCIIADDGILAHKNINSCGYLAFRNGYKSIDFSNLCFGDNKYKHLIKMSIYSEENITVAIKGRFGKKEMMLLSGNNQAIINLFSDVFSITFSTSSNLKINSIYLSISD